MTIDAKLVLKETQSLTANGTTDSVDLGEGTLEVKTAYLRATVKTPGTGAGSVQLVAEGSDDNSTWEDIASGTNTDAVELAAGSKLKVPLPASKKRYIRGKIVVTSTVSTGDAFIDIELG